MLKISDNIEIPEDELEISAVRAQGAGGQNVNKVSSAIHLRFDIAASTHLPGDVKARLLARRDRRISGEGVAVIKAQRFRSQEKNRADALRRLSDLLREGLTVPRKRVATRPGRAAREKRLREKAHRSEVKSLRRKPGS